MNGTSTPILSSAGKNTSDDASARLELGVIRSVHRELPLRVRLDILDGFIARALESDSPDQGDVVLRTAINQLDALLPSNLSPDGKSIVVAIRLMAKEANNYKKELARQWRMLQDECAKFQLDEPELPLQLAAPRAEESEPASAETA